MKTLVSRLVHILLLGRRWKNMAAVYFYLIIDGLWTYKKVGAAYKEEVKTMLIKAGRPELVEED